MQRNAFEQAQLQQAQETRAARWSIGDDELVYQSLRLLQGALWVMMGASTTTLLIYNLALWMARHPG